MSFATFATAVGICPTSTYSFPTNSLGKLKVFAKWISCVFNDDQTAMHVLDITHMRRWRNEGIAFLDRI
jgi:hypothetical protein